MKPLLEVSKLHAWYGESHVLHGVDVTVGEGEVVGLLGRNGAGRTSTLRAILGLVSRREGSIKVAGRETIAMAPHRIPRLGIGYCPEERGIFASLSAEENLKLPPVIAEGGMSVVSDISDRITVLQRGQILAEGSYAEVSQDPRVVSAYLGTVH